ncbi:A24 family peptidase [Pseudoduganella namucuonensis]|uniref:Prepilin peptidase CpaA n=1 Tax=Pseudoduganella namucuonensis TaxID=1035707 RepID=A0A1I7LL77_9BURK|nr:prepilin peptidase [Pseudoduganella namucuonensis]SFV10389.1 prepilin peptidase CpaA [Pseudoduganella namucuonensis]
MLNAIEVVLLWLVIQAAVTDLAVRKIPNVLVLSGLLLALALHWRMGPPWATLSSWLAGGATGFLLFLPLYALRGMAAGDVKLMAMVGAFAGPAQALHIALLSIMAGGVLGLLMMAASGRLRQGLRNLATLLWPMLLRLAGVPAQPVPLPRGASVGGMPYAVAVAAGSALSILSGHFHTAG